MTNRDRRDARRRAAEVASDPFDRITAGRFTAWFPEWSDRRLRARVHREALDASYRAAAVTDIRRNSERKLGGTADQHALPWDLWKLAEEARSLERDNCIVDGLLTRVCDNVVGTDIRPNLSLKDHGLERQAIDWFNEWSLPDYGDPAKSRIDITGRLTRVEMTKLLLRSTARDGDVFARLDDESGQVQCLERERVGTPLNKLGRMRRDKNGNAIADGVAPGNLIVNGVEMDRVGRPVAYWVGEPMGKIDLPDYSNPITNPYLKADAQRIPARNMIHLMDPKRFTQTRGVTWFHSTLELYDMLDEYIEAELVGAKVSAMFTVFIAQQDAEMNALYRAKLQSQPDTAAGYYYERLKSGTVMYGEPGEGVTEIGGKRPNPNLSPFVKSMLRFMGLPFGMPLELMLLDFSEAGWSASRASILQAYQRFRILQEWLINHFLTRIWRWRMGMAVRNGDLPAIPDLFKVTWLPPGWKWVNPEDYAAAKGMELDRCMDTLAGAAAEMGKDWEDLVEQRVREITFAAMAAKKVEQDTKGEVKIDWHDVIAASPKGAAPGQGTGEPSVTKVKGGKPNA